MARTKGKLKTAAEYDRELPRPDTTEAEPTDAPETVRFDPETRKQIEAAWDHTLTNEEFLQALGEACGIAVDPAHANRSQPHPWPDLNRLCVDLNSIHERASALLGYSPDVHDSLLQEAQGALLCTARDIAMNCDPAKSPLQQ